MTFIEEILQESEVREDARRLEMTKLRADQILAAMSLLEKKADDVNKLADEEIKLVEAFRQGELQKLEKQASWLSYQLESYMRSVNQQDPTCKSLALPHGTLKLRQGRDKVEITDLDRFMKIADKRGLLRKVPESAEPDLQKVLAYVRQYGFLSGVTLVPGSVKFTYQTKGGSNGKEED